MQIELVSFGLNMKDRLTDEKVGATWIYCLGINLKNVAWFGSESRATVNLSLNVDHDNVDGCDGGGDNINTNNNKHKYNDY